MEPRKPIPGRRRCFERGRQHVSDAPSQGPNGPAWSKNLACAEAPWTGTGRSHVWPAAVRRSGPHREGGAVRRTARHGDGSRSWRMTYSPGPASFIRGPKSASPSGTRGGSRVPEWGPLGSVRGALSNERPYRDLRNSETLERGEPSFHPEMLRQENPDIPCRNDWTYVANGASVSSVDVALFASSWILPLWRYRHCGASVVTARVPSQPKGSERCRTATHPARPRSRRPSARKSLQSLKRLPRVRAVAGLNRKRSSGCLNSPREQRSPRS